MSAPLELDDVLSELRGRRRRLIELADPGQTSVAVLVDELSELGEQLLVADEELRVQQAELDDARRRLQRTVAERDSLWQSSPVAQLVTDARGVVLRTNRAADALVRRPSARVTPRPIATWFEVADRPAVRSAIGAAVAATGVRRFPAAVRRPEGPLPVEGAVEPAGGSGGAPDELLLRWSVAEPERDPAPVLAVVPDRPAALPGDDHATLAAVTAFTARIAAMGSAPEVVAEAARVVRSFVAGADDAGMVSLGRGGLRTVPGSGALAATLDGVQTATGEGPVHEALATGRPVLVHDVATEPRWRGFAAAAAALGLGSVIVVPLPDAVRQHEAFTCVSRASGAFGEDAVGSAHALAVQVGLVCARTVETGNLRKAVESRQQIGEAVGVLVERHRITTTVAFQTLVAASQNSNTKLRDVAQLVIDTGQDPDQARSR